ncbi:uncharacterized protein LOC143201509 [Rhynchophorus ferrugineus]|uniref:Uncharacterized protein n=1 Tax=Rhynchophorus ferrugineus TaxID=354439 RepID=A0A834IUU9_RHYFE|nr:hypothetical protein GWI33_004195 [Rhynchophorus ferrugineus]
MIVTKTSFVFLVLVGSVIKLTDAQRDPQRQKIIDFHAECLDAHGVDEEAMIEALDGHPPDDDAFYMHLFCAAKKAKVMDENGTVNVDNFHIDMAHVIDEHNMENIHNIVKKCLIQKEDVLSTLRAAVQCFVNESHNL